MSSLILFFLMSLALSAGITFLLVFTFGFFRIGQSIREEGPKEHKKKSGTPTMGGIGFMTVFLVMAVVFIDMDWKVLSLLLLAAGFALIGFTDDFIKLRSSTNQGLLPWQKMGLQAVLALLFGTVLLFNFHDTTVSGFLKAAWFGQPWLYIPLVCVIIVGSANATNLTDGLDGLLAGTAAVAFICFSVIASKHVSPDIAGLCIIAAGCLAGFLIFNFNPAKIFMGDSGSLGLGALLAGVAILLHKEILLLLIGGVFVIETLSVILQVSFFKLTKGRRLFRMSPLHHHFELMGIKERAVVFMAWAAAAVFSIVAVVIG